MEQQGEKSIYKKWWFWVSSAIVLVIVISIFSAPREQTRTTAPTEAPKPVAEEVVKISAVEVSEEYDANKVAADAKYKGKTLEISGVIDNIGKDIIDTPYVTLKGRELSLFGVQCMFGKADEPKLVTLSKGQNITLRGKVSGELIGDIIVRGCQIVER